MTRQDVNLTGSSTHHPTTGQSLSKELDARPLLDNAGTPGKRLRSKKTRRVRDAIKTKIELFLFLASLTDYAVVDRIIDHLKLTFVAERPPPPHIAYQEVLMAAEAGSDYAN